MTAKVAEKVADELTVTNRRRTGSASYTPKGVFKLAETILSVAASSDGLVAELAGVKSPAGGNGINVSRVTRTPAP